MRRAQDSVFSLRLCLLVCLCLFALVFSSVIYYVLLFLTETFPTVMRVF